MIRKLLYTCVLAMLIFSLAFGAEVRKLGEYDLSWGPYGTTWTSPAGKVVRYLPRYFSSDAFSDGLTLYSNDLITGGPWVDVRKFAPTGTLADGTVDWTAYIQAAIDYAASITGATGSSMIVFLPRGIYLISDALDFEADGVGLRGVGAGSIIQTSANANVAIKLAQTHRIHRAVFEDFQIEGTSSNAGAITVGSASHQVTASAFDRVGIHGFTATNAYGLKLKNSVSNDFRNVYLDKNYNNIYVEASSSITSTVFSGAQCYINDADNIGALFEGTITDISFIGGCVFQSSTKEALRSTGAGSTIRVKDSYFEANNTGAAAGSHVYVSGTSGADNSAVLIWRDNKIIQPATSPFMQLDYVKGVIDDQKLNTVVADWKVETTANTDVRWGDAALHVVKPSSATSTRTQTLKMTSFTISDGTSADTINVSSAATAAYSYGDTNTAEDNLAKSGDTGVFALDSSGSIVTLQSAGISGTLVGALISQITYADTPANVPITCSISVSSGNITLYFTNSTTGANFDLTTLVAPDQIQVRVLYITSP